MTESEPIVCKPTPWFIWRAILMLAMFAGFSGWFAYDGLVGYKEKNEVYFMKQAFDQAQEDFDEMKKDGLTKEQWVAHVEAQKVEFPEGAEEILPADVSTDQPWPDELKNYEQIQDSLTVAAWEDYTGKRGMNADDPPKDENDAGEIRTQLILSGVCAVLALVTVYFLLRTIKRRMSASATSLSLPDGSEFNYSEITRLDKRKWDTKGLALVYAEDGAESRKGRIDGLTYGGFKKDEGEPAEKLMQRIQANMNGEVIEYIDADEDLEADEEEATSPSEESSQ